MELKSFLTYDLQPVDNICTASNITSNADIRSTVQQSQGEEVKCSISSDQRSEVTRESLVILTPGVLRWRVAAHLTGKGDGLVLGHLEYLDLTITIYGWWNYRTKIGIVLITSNYPNRTPCTMLDAAEVRRLFLPTNCRPMICLLVPQWGRCLRAWRHMQGVYYNLIRTNTLKPTLHDNLQDMTQSA